MDRPWLVGHFKSENDQGYDSCSDGQPISDLDVVDQGEDVVRQDQVGDCKESLKNFAKHRMV